MKLTIEGKDTGNYVRARVFDTIVPHKPIMIMVDVVNENGEQVYHEPLLFIHCDKVEHCPIVKQLALYFEGRYLGSVPYKWLTRN